MFDCEYLSKMVREIVDILEGLCIMTSKEKVEYDQIDDYGKKDWWLFAKVWCLFWHVVGLFTLPNVFLFTWRMSLNEHCWEENSLSYKEIWVVREVVPWPQESL